MHRKKIREGSGSGVGTHVGAGDEGWVCEVMRVTRLHGSKSSFATEVALVNCGLVRRAKRVRRWDGVGRDGSKRMVKGRSKRRKGRARQEGNGVNGDVTKTSRSEEEGRGKGRGCRRSLGFGVCVVSSLIPTLVNSCSLETRA